MATPKQIICIATGASGILTVVPSVPSVADNLIIRMESGTARWSETTGSFLNASVGLLLSAADAPFRIANPTAFAFVPVGGAAVLQALPYQGYDML